MSTTSHVPWSVDVDAAAVSIRQAMNCDAIAVAIVRSQNPLPDEFILSRGISPRQLTNWCMDGHRKDEAFREARRKGSGESEDSSIVAGRVLMQMMPVSLQQQRWWLLVLARRQSTFSARDAIRAELLLRQWQATFDAPNEPGGGRLLLGSDGRLIHVDPVTQMRLLDDPGVFRDLYETLRTVVGERWPELTEGRTYDLVLALAGKPFWVLFHRNNAAGVEQGSYWHLELRPLSDDDLPPIGITEDPRIAQAIAWLHEHYAESPNLHQIAAAVHTSPFHFHRMFSRQVGISPKQYLQRQQLQVAKWMLRATRAPIGEIARSAGFASHGHFTSTFHRLVGMSPTHYREGGYNAPHDAAAKDAQ